MSSRDIFVFVTSNSAIVNTLYISKTFKTPVDVDKAIEVCSKNIDIESGYPYLELYSN